MAAVDLLEAELFGLARGDVDHALGEVADQHPSFWTDESRGGEADQPVARGELEDLVTGFRREAFEHLLGDRPSPFFHVGAPSVPAGRHGVPHVLTGSLELGRVHQEGTLARAGFVDR